MSLASCGQFAFAMASEFHSLTSPIPWTPWLFIQKERCNPDKVFRAATFCSCWVSGSFHPLIWGAFQLSFTVLVSYRSQDVFRVGSCCLPYSDRNPNLPYSGTSSFLLSLRLRGYHPLWRLFPEDFDLTLEKKCWPKHHICAVSRQHIQFALFPFPSPVIRESQLISFPTGTKMFQFPAFPLPCGSI